LYAESEFAEAIKNLDTAFYWHKKNGDINGMYFTLLLAYWVYNAAGNYEKAFELARKCLNIAREINNDSFKKNVSIAIAELFIVVEDYEKALEYYRQGNAPARVYAGIFIRLQQYDSAKYYFSLADTSHVDTSDTKRLRAYLQRIGEGTLIGSNIIKPCLTLSGH
jgi:tetratricopeptide (TPR) repeat protein